MVYVQQIYKYTRITCMLVRYRLLILLLATAVHIYMCRSIARRSVLCPHSTQTTNPTNRHESINVRIRDDSWNFANFLSKSCRSKILLQYRYDIVTNIRGNRLESLKYGHEFLRFTRIDYEYCTDVRNQLGEVDAL